MGEKLRGPLIIAALHQDRYGLRDLVKTGEAVAEAVRKHGVKGARVFIEGEQKIIEQQMREDTDPSRPYALAAATAAEKGMEVVGLDTKEMIKAFYGHENRGDIELMRFTEKNLREWSWAKKVEQTEPPVTEDDIVIMHPNHVEGFLKNSRMAHEIVWVDQPYKSDLKRLSEDEVVGLMAEKTKTKNRMRLS